MSPSSRPLEAIRRLGLLPPWSRCPVRKFFQKIIFDKFGNIPTTLRVIGPRAARISNRLGVEGLAGAARLTEYPSGSVTRLLRRHSASTQELSQYWERCRWRCAQRARSPSSQGGSMPITWGKDRIFGKFVLFRAPEDSLAETGGTRSGLPLAKGSPKLFFDCGGQGCRIVSGKPSSKPFRQSRKIIAITVCFNCMGASSY
jgi:hypothetical protein